MRSLPIRLKRVPKSRRNRCLFPNSHSTKSSIRSPPMPNGRFDWHEHLKAIEREHLSWLPEEWG